MNIDYLKSFITVFDTGSFSKAAEKLYITQPTISNHISKLEDELNSKLLIRNKKKLLLTKQGKMIYKYALNLIQMEENVKNKLIEYNKSVSGDLIIASSTIPERYFLLEILDDFHKKHEEIKFILKRYDSGEIINLLIDLKLDFGIVGTKKHNPNLIYTPLFKDEIVLIGASKFYNDIDSISIENLNDYKFISREKNSGTRRETTKFLKTQGFNYSNLNIYFEIMDNDCILDLLKKQPYLSFLSKKVISKKQKDFKIINIDHKIERDFYFVYNKNRVMSPLSQKFKNYILK